LLDIGIASPRSLLVKVNQTTMTIVVDEELESTTLEEVPPPALSVAS
jgi:hypothetical protein